MTKEILKFDQPVTLVGGGWLDRPTLDRAMALAPLLIAADGAADRLAGWGLCPVAVIGDMDSLADRRAWHGRTRLVPLAEQDTTDFEKCLYSVAAPYFVAAGFTGQRIDHTLAVLHGLVCRPEKRVFLIGEAEAMTLLPSGREIALEVGRGAAVSLFPLRPARGLASRGLEWPIDGMDLEIGRQIGTSNRATRDRIAVTVEGQSVLLAVPRDRLGCLIGAVLGG